MSKTTSEWEALLKDTTAGPWKWEPYEVPTLSGRAGTPGVYEYDVEVLDANHDGGCGCRSSCELEMEVNDPDKALIAAAPAAVAEVVRLRRELEERVAQYTANMHYQTKYEEGLANAYRYAALDLIDILEGNNE